MATQEYAASIQGVAIRVTRLSPLGIPLNGPGDSYTAKCFMRVSFTPEYEEGDEITEKGADGTVCVSYKAPDTLKRITMELAIPEPDPELTNLLSGGLLLRKITDTDTNGDPVRRSVGWAAPAVGDDPSGNGVAIEAWSLAIKEGKKANILPYFHWIFPYVKLRQSGDRVIENGLLANTFEGFGLGNDQFQTGLDGRWEYPIAAERPYAYARTNWAPSGLTGFFTWHAALSEEVTALAIADSVATITTGGAHGFAVGEQATISGVAAGVDGSRTITGVTGTTFTVQADDTATPQPEAAATGSVVVPAGPRAVTDLGDGGDTGVYNVPGNVQYNADSDVDFIINSNRDADTES